MSSAIELYVSPDGSAQVQVRLSEDTVWLSQTQIGEVFGVGQPAASKHLSNIFSSGELDEETSYSILEYVADNGRRVETKLYNLDAIISVGYRVNSKNATTFRRWATTVLRTHLVEGYTVNQRRLDSIGRVLEILQRTDDVLVSGVADVLQTFASGLSLLDDYDHQVLSAPKGGEPTWELTYDEARAVIDSMRFGAESSLFGQERDGSFAGVVAGIYQSFGGVEMYPSVEEKAANLLYLLVKDHCFVDGNKRIAAALFVYFLDRNRALIGANGRPRIGNNALAAMTVMIAVSKPEEKDIMCLLVRNMLDGGEA